MRLLRALAAVGIALQLFAPMAAAAAGDMPTRIPNQGVYDLAGALSSGTKTTAESMIGTTRRATHTDIVLVVEPADATLSIRHCGAGPMRSGTGSTSAPARGAAC